jgi:outer membrane lipoprotein SlyB
MRIIIGCAVVILTLASATTANAKGCLKGAAVGGVAGHYAGHHGLLGAAAGCVIGRHEANKRERMQTNQKSDGRPLREGEEHL